MNWVKVEGTHYVNIEQVRDVMLVKKNETFFYRMSYLNGSSFDLKKFPTEKEAFEHANKYLGLEDGVKEQTFKEPVAKKAKK